MMLSRSRPGYVFLISVLAIGAIAATTSVSMILLGLASQQSGSDTVQSTQAREHAFTCIERALRTLRSDPAYIGEETIALTNGTCTLSSVGGYGNEKRSICAEGISGVSRSKVEVLVKTLLPTTFIDTWREVTSFTLCP